MGSGSEDVAQALMSVLYTDSAVAGEAAGIGLGLVMMGSSHEATLKDMLVYAKDTEHEKIIRSLSVGIGLIMFGRKQEADPLIERLLEEEDPLLRLGAVHTITMAYCGTGDNNAIRKLLHLAVSDVKDDVRRAAVTGLGFVLLRSPEQVPRMVELLSESFNPHVRAGAALALGIACAGSGSKAAIAILEPMGVKKFGAAISQGIIDAGGRNVSIGLTTNDGQLNMAACGGMLLFTQFWYWFPLAHFLALAFKPTALIAINKDLKAPKLDAVCLSRKALFAYPAAIEQPAVVAPTKIATAVLSTTAKAKRIGGGGGGGGSGSGGSRHAPAYKHTPGRGAPGGAAGGSGAQRPHRGALRQRRAADGGAGGGRSAAATGRGEAAAERGQRAAAAVPRRAAGGGCACS
ncbi:proteasome regulatory particle base subunit [Coemansia sp. RSA 2673]|nr:proteasome regulatory particle base subunit [Coemansia sp. RSA 2673]